MTFKKIGVAACMTIASGLYACSSTTNTGSTPTDGGTVYKPLDAGNPGDDTNGDGGGVTGPGVGNACTTNADCANDAGPSGQCSASGFFTAGPLFPSPVCLSENCTVPADPNQIGICGNDALPGLCQAGQQGSPSVCFPLCLVTGAGAVSGCLAHDACRVAGTTTDPTTNATEIIGMCQPGCTADAQCPSGTKCDTYQSVCVATPTVFTTAFGSSCDPTTTTTCLCIGTSASTVGFCSSTCVTGSGSCPSATASAGDGGTTDAGGGAAVPYVCSAQLGGINQSDAGISFATQPSGLSGFCFQPCNTAAECTLAGSTCQPDPAGAPKTGICALP